MKSKRSQAPKLTYKFTNLATMKFQPQYDFQQVNIYEKQTMMTRLKNFFSPQKQHESSPSKRLNSIDTTRQDKSKSKINKKGKLKYLRKLTNQHVLIGNQDQLDVLFLGGVIEEFVDTQFEWSLNIKKPIQHVTVDIKKNYILLLPDREVRVYEYDPKMMKEKAKMVTSLTLKHDVRFVQVVKDSTFILCFATYFKVYTINQNKIVANMQKSYQIPAYIDEKGIKRPRAFRLFQIPQPCENVLNIFFEETLSGKTDMFSIWHLEIEFQAKQIKVNEIRHLYKVSNSQRDIIKLLNYSKKIIFLCLGKLILAIRQGYVIDKAEIKEASLINSLCYLSNLQKLIHVSNQKVEVYDFKMDLHTKPPTVILKSTDSIISDEMGKQYDFFDSIQINKKNQFAVFYQIKEQKNTYIKGQIKYAFYITQFIEVEEKIKYLLPDLKKLTEQDFKDDQTLNKIKEKADMINKMGYERKDIYLRLWNNSEKTSVEDFKFLLDTYDYETIKKQIENKLKKNSMNFRQLLKIETGCMTMLSENVYSPNYTKQHIKNYFISHFFITKLQLYLKISLAEKAAGKKINQDSKHRMLMNYQSYSQYIKMDVVSHIIQLIQKYCNDEGNSEAIIQQLRYTFKFMKFPLRSVYEQLIIQIINVSKKKILKILKAMPELIYYQPVIKPGQDPAQYQGIWREISIEQWDKALYKDTVETIYNKDELQTICSNIWFKRHWLTSHYYVNYTKQQIIKIDKKNKSQETFYIIIEKIFEVVGKGGKDIKQIMDFLQNNYQKLPQHLFGKIFLYRKLFENFRDQQKNIKMEDKVTNFSSFLKLKDQQLFRFMFNLEKIRKNFILKQVKALYNRLAGPQVFNQGLLNYFASDLSSISDIKYLLNRMNNEKQQFHVEHQSLYVVLIRGMQLKLRLGSQREVDIPIDQVLIYIENIPIAPENPINRQLDIMQLINEESKRFNEIKFNMSIFEMTKNLDIVIAAMILHEIKKANVLQIRDLEELRNQTYRIIAEIKTVKQKIFTKEQEQSDLTIFIYLTKLMEEPELISLVSQLLQDQSLNKYFQLNETMIENIVLFAYKRKLIENNVYIDNQEYLNKLIEILSSNNRVRHLIESEIYLAKVLSGYQKVKYPICGRSEFFNTTELSDLLNKVPGNQLLELDIQKVFECSLKVQQISSDNQLSEITLAGTYETVIIRLVQEGFILQVIVKIRSLMQLQGDSPFNFIYPCFVINKLSKELIQQNRNIFLEVVSYLVKKPTELLDRLDKLLNTKATNVEQKIILKEWLSQVQVNQNYNESNPLLEPIYIKSIKNQQEISNFKIIVDRTMKQLLSVHSEFNTSVQFNLIYIMLVNDPYISIKYVYNSRNIIDFKALRCFLSYLSKEDIFAKPHLLQFSKRMFFIVENCLRLNKNTVSLVEEYRGIPLDVCKEYEKIENSKNSLELRINKSLERIKLKLKIYNKKKKTTEQLEENKISRIQEILKNPTPLKEHYRPQYPFQDSDDNLEKKDQKMQESVLQKPKSQFDERFERATIISRRNTNVSAYISMKKLEKQKRVFYSETVQKGIHGSLRISPKIKGAVPSFDQDLLLTPRGQQIFSQRENNKIQQLPIKDNLNFGDKQQTLLPEDIKLEYKPSSVFQIVEPDLENKLGLKVFAENLFKVEGVLNEKSVFNLSSFDQYKDAEKLPSFLIAIANEAYNMKEIPFQIVLNLLKQMNKTYSEYLINKDYMAIYTKIQGLQEKFKLSIPLRDILKIQGLYLQSETVQSLFDFLLPHIVACSNESNILKISKLMSLSFKKTEIEQQIYYNYLLSLLTNYQRQSYNPSLKEKDIAMHFEKINAIIDKLPGKFLRMKDEEMTTIFPDSEIKVQIMKHVVASLKKKFENKEATYLENKWVKKIKNFEE